MTDPNTELSEEQKAIKEELEAKNKEVAKRQQDKLNKKEYRAFLEELGIPIY